MAKILKTLFAGAFAFIALASCNEKEESIDNPAAEYDDSYYAAQATISSSDANFITNDNGGEIRFNTEGGNVVVNVNCECDWIAENSAANLFITASTSTTLTVIAGRNTLEQELTGTITLKTATQQITFATISVVQSAYGTPEISVETNEWSFPAVGTLTLTTEIAVTATADWTAKSPDEWLSVQKTETGIILTADENGTTEARSTTVQLVCTDGVRTTREYVTVNQDAAANITLSVQTLFFAADEESSSITVYSNFDWDYSYDSSNGWFTISRYDDVLTVSVSVNNGDSRAGTVTLTAGDGAENVSETQLTVSQAGESDMVLTYTITSSDTKIQLPLSGTVNCTVNWGDGSDIETTTSSLPSHTYSAIGEYDVVISGTANRLNSANISSINNPLTAVKQWGSTGLNSMRYAFYCCEKLSSLPKHTDRALANVTDFYAAFYSTAITGFPEDLFSGCTKATNFGFLCCKCPDLKSLPNGLFDDCTKATTFESAFQQCHALETIPSGLFDSCTEVTSFEWCFYECYSLKEIPQGLFDNCLKVEDFRYIFSYCSTIVTIPDGLFANCPEATSFATAFYECSSLKTIPADMFANCPKVTSFSSLFYSCTSLEAIPEGLFDGCPEVTVFHYLFYNTSVSSIPAKLFANNTKAKNFNAAFYNCTKLTEIPAGLFDNCPLATTFSYIFEFTSITAIPENLFAKNTEATAFLASFSWTSITEIPTNLFANNKKVEDFYCTFDTCTEVTGESPYDIIDGEKVHLYERANYPDIYTAPTSHRYCFYDCTNLTDYGKIPSNWGGGASTSSISAKETSPTPTCSVEITSIPNPLDKNEKNL